MRRLLYLATVAVALGYAGEAFSQGGMSGGAGGGQGGGGGGISLGSGGGQSGGGGGGSTLLGGNNFSGNSFTGGSNSGLTGGAGGTSTPGRTGAGGRTIGGAGVSISPTNFLSASYGNPLYNGRPGTSNASPTAGGGFGQPSFGSTTTTTANRTTNRTTGTRATTTSNLGRVGTTPSSPITFATEVKFSAPAVRPSQLQVDLQGAVARTTQLKKPGDVRVEVVGSTVILHGRVSDEDEKRLVEGMVRMEPGIHEVRNELISK